MKTFFKKCVAIFVITVIVMFGCLPFKNVNAGTFFDGRAAYPGKWTGVSSTSERILAVMCSQLNYPMFVSKTKYNYYQLGDSTHEHLNEVYVYYDQFDKLYHLKIPENYFNIYKPYGTDVGYIWDKLIGYEDENYCDYPLDYSEKYGARDRVDEFNFSGENLGDISTLPDFSKWAFSGGNPDSGLGASHILYLNF